MDNQIENLSISLTASAASATRAIDSVVASAERLRGASTRASGGVDRLSGSAKDAGMATREAGKESENAEKHVRRFGKSAEDAGKSAKKGASGLANFWQSLKRIAYYRFIRTVLKEIGAAFKEGVTNLYNWSSAIDGTFAKSMDRIATSSLYLKNSLGAMLAPLINTLAPIIDWVIDRIVEAINWINKLFAALSGSQTYTVAKKVATTWGDAGKTASGSAKKAADDIKRTILGFDEINKLEKQNTSSGGGGGGSSSTGQNYNDMFETRRLDGWMAALASFIDRFKIGWAGVLGGILAGWAAIKAAIRAVTKLSLGWLKDMAGKTINVGVGLVRKGWTTIKTWLKSFGEAIVDVAVRINNSAFELWTKLSTEWALLNPVLKVGIVASVTAAALWLAYKIAWALVPDKVLDVQLAIKTKMATLRNKIMLEWATLGAWALNAKLKLSTTAAQLKNDIINGWNKLTSWTLGVAVKLITTAAQLKNDIINGWNKLTAWTLGVNLRITTKASDLFESLKKSWNSGKEKVVSFGVTIGTKLSDLWDWIKKNWEYVALGALGIAIAIATPWPSLAAALSGLWADVMASFGGALSFAVAPVLSLFPTKKELDNQVLNGPLTKEELAQNQANYETWQGRSGIGRGDTWMKGSSLPSPAELTAQGYYNIPTVLNTLQTESTKTFNKIAGGSAATAKMITKHYVGNGGVTDSLIGGTKKVDSTASSSFTKFRDMVTAKLSEASASSTSELNGLQSNVESIFDRTNAKASQTAASIVSRLSTMNSTIGSNTAQTFSQISANVGSSTQTVNSRINSMANSVTTNMNNANRSASNSINGIRNKLISDSEDVSWAVDSSFGNIQNSIVWNVANARNAAGSVSFYNVGANIVTGIYNGITSGWNWLTNTVSNLARSLLSAAKWVLGIRSPSRVFRDEVGKMIGLGMSEGILDAKPEALKAITELSDSVTNQLNRRTLNATVRGAMPDYTGGMDFNMPRSGEAAQGDDRMDREIALLQALLTEMQAFNEKEFTADITTSGMTRAMNRTNRRAGVTVVPVG